MTLAAVSTAPRANIGRRARLWSVAAGAIFLVFALIVFGTSLQTIYRYRFPTLFFDQWVDAGFYQSLVNGTFDFGTLFNQHNEHRIFFPRLVFLLDFLLDRGRNEIDIATIVLIQFLHGLLLLKLFVRRPGKGGDLLAAIALTLILMFSLAQRQNLLWGFQVCFVEVGLASSVAFVGFAAAADRCRRHLPYGWLSAGVIAAMTVATFSLSNGILAGLVIVLFCVTMWLPLRFTAPYVLATAALGFAYFWNFKAVSFHSPYAYSFSHPLLYLDFLASFLGNVAGVFGPSAEVIFGTVGLLSASAMAVLFLIEREHAPARTALFAIVLFAVGTAMLISLGRVSMGLDLAATERYFSPVAVFWIATVFFWHSQFVEKALPIPSVFLAVAVAIVAAGPSVVHFQKRLQVKHEAFAYDRAAVSLASNIEDEQALRTLFPNMALIEAGGDFLRSHRLSIFATDEAASLGRPLTDSFSILPPGACAGHVDLVGSELGVVAPGLGANGWAWNVMKKRTVKRVLLVGPSGNVVGFAAGGTPRADINAQNPQTGRNDVGWRGYAHAADGDVVTAYAVLKPGKACPIGTATAIYRPAGVAELSALGSAIDAPVAADGALTRNPGRSGLGPLSLSDAVYGSWSGPDSNVGNLTFGPFIAPSETVMLPFVTGPISASLQITVSDAQTGVPRFIGNLPTATTWHALAIPVGPDALGRPLIVKLSNYTLDLGDWFAVGALHAPAGR